MSYDVGFNMGLNMMPRVVECYLNGLGYTTFRSMILAYDNMLKNLDTNCGSVLAVDIFRGVVKGKTLEEKEALIKEMSVTEKPIKIKYADVRVSECTCGACKHKFKEVVWDDTMFPIPIYCPKCEAAFANYTYGAEIHLDPEEHFTKMINAKLESEKSKRESS